MRAERLDELLLLSLDRPEKRNALTRPMIEELTAALAEVTSRGVILAGDGPSFSSGVDLHEFASATPDSARALIEALRRLCATVRSLPVPVVCAIQGHCLGGALELAACCDLRVCTPDATLGMPEVFLGMPSVIDAAILPRLIGAARGHELLLTGQSVSGDQAYAWGLVNRLAPPVELIATATALLRMITRHDPAVVAAQKRLHWDWLGSTYEQAVADSIEPFVSAFITGTPQRIAAERLSKR